MKRTQLYEQHVALGGRMVDFAGWELPVQYPTGPLEEHRRVREAVGLFDIDHMGQVVVEGPDALDFLQRVQVNDLSTLEVAGARYSLMCYADGTVVDDIFVYRLAETTWWVIVNASNRQKDVTWLQSHRAGHRVSVTDISDATYMLAIQGPRAQGVLQQVVDVDLGQVPFHTCRQGHLNGIPVLIGSTGYTGEYGYELFFPAEQAVTVWQTLLEVGQPAGILPCGLAARDSLRFEPCLPLYGHEIHASIDPISARLAWAVSFSKGDFVGRDALLKIKLEGPAQRLVGFEMVERGVPRAEYPVAVNGQVVGVVTTGMKSPTTERFVGLAYVPAAHAALDSLIDIVIRDAPKQARVVKTPFYVAAYRRKSG
jgi:aminomethyltransferase